VSFQEVPELTDGGLVRNAFAAQVTANEGSHPLLSYSASSTAGSLRLTSAQKIDPQHAVNIDRRPSRALARWIVTLDDPTKPLLRDYAIHLGKKLSALRRLRVSLEAGRRQRDLPIRHA
jgi:hypothetical protein